MNEARGFLLNSPRRSQQLSEGNLSDYGSMLDRIAGIGQNMTSAGQGMYSKGVQRGDSLWGSLNAAANKSPTFAVNQAAVDSQMTTENALAANARNMSRMGINPNSGRFQGLMAETQLTGAANKAGEMNKARRAASVSQFGNLLSTVGLAANQAGQGLNYMGQGAGLANQAGQGYDQLAEQYGSLGSGMAQNEKANAFIPKRARTSLMMR